MWCAGILGCLVPEIFHQLLLRAKKSDAAKKKKDDCALFRTIFGLVLVAVCSDFWWVALAAVDLSLEPVVDASSKTVSTPK